MLEKKYKRNCPKCQREVYHTDKYNRNSAERKGNLCKTCISDTLRSPTSDLKRKCPRCKKELKYTSTGNCRDAEKKGTCCKKCLSNSGEEFKQNCRTCNSIIIYKRESDYKKTLKKKPNCNKCNTRIWAENNIEKCRVSSKKWSKEKESEYVKNKKNTDSSYKILCNLRSRVSGLIKENTKTGSTIDLLGCSIEDFKNYLSNKFDEKMSWDNYTIYWEIDHIKPCAWFDFSLEEHQKECFHYSNMRPLDIKTNRGRGVKK